MSIDIYSKIEYNIGISTIYAENCERRFIMDNNNFVRFLLTFFLGWIGSLIINHTSLRPEGYKSRTLAYFFLSMITLGIYGLVASICNLTFDPNKASNIGYFKV